MKFLDAIHVLREVIGFHKSKDKGKQFFSQFLDIWEKTDKGLDNVRKRSDHFEA